MKTRYGVEYEIEKSNFFVRTSTGKFYFSSLLHEQKFRAGHELNRARMNYSLTKRFGIKTDYRALPDIVFYSKIETRGFYVECLWGDVRCLNDIISTSDTLTRRN